jgi:hypothetical protein
MPKRTNVQLVGIDQQLPELTTELPQDAFGRERMFGLAPHHFALLAHRIGE